MNLRETLQNIALHDGCIDLSDFSADAMINGVLDAVCETNRRSAKELGLDEIEIHYLIEDVNKLRQEK